MLKVKRIRGKHTYPNSLAVLPPSKGLAYVAQNSNAIYTEHVFP
uniref:Uncharacterized protein n=1 Tax=Anguilla anguilla TaxID=7936 RepID=A0A0E9P6F1_ANGAN